MAPSTGASPPPPIAGRPRVMKKCSVEGCDSFARSRGCCKAHGGGKRCGAAGCDLSDQGGGRCIRHGGGRRCEMPGCAKSAQSRRFCKAHGGGVRCRVEGCNKTSQGGGCCRSHGGGGPRGASKKQAQQLRSSLPGTLTPRARACDIGARASEAATVKTERPASPPPLSIADTQSLLALKTLPEPSIAADSSKLGEFTRTPRPSERLSDALQSCRCRGEGCGHVRPSRSGHQQRAMHDENILQAASLLDLLSAGSL